MTLREHLNEIISNATHWTEKEVTHAIAALAILNTLQRHAEATRIELVCALRPSNARNREPDLAAAHRHICAIHVALHHLPPHSSLDSTSVHNPDATQDCA